MFCMVDRGGQSQRINTVETRKWNMARLNRQTFIETMDENTDRVQLNSNNLSLVDYKMGHITRNCNASMPKRKENTSLLVDR